MDTRDFGMLFGNALTNSVNIAIADNEIDVEVILERARHIARLAYASQLELVKELDITAPPTRKSGGQYSGSGRGGYTPKSTTPVAGDGAASEKQVKFATRLMEERSIPVPPGLDGGDKKVVSTLIEGLLANDMGKVQEQLEQL